MGKGWCSVYEKGNKQHHGKKSVQVACEYRDWNLTNITVKVKWQWMPGGVHKHHFLVFTGGHQAGNTSRSFHWRSKDLEWSYGEDKGHTSAVLNGTFDGAKITEAIEHATIDKRYDLYDYCCNHWVERVTSNLGQKIHCPTHS
uniref:Uncharacterized protein n=1 Tax=Timspurckia oligopyrenoides TaxID=708627 RepID=A0A7S0ZBD9_9RHOD|mmetsp:Transcript_11219/g.20267  ORF Transcript_11219/g.20267 Transcript_11219/m.20267 type:complete len:143 (+) Transcript_11219:102-530(+)